MYPIDRYSPIGPPEKISKVTPSKAPPAVAGDAHRSGVAQRKRAEMMRRPLAAAQPTSVGDSYRLLQPTALGDLLEQIQPDLLEYRESLMVEPMKILLADDGSIPARHAQHVAQVLADHYHAEIIARSVRSGDVAAEIMDAAYQHQVSCIAIGTHGRQGAAYHRLGSVAETVVSQAHCPVMVCRRVPVPWTVRHILVPVDGTPFSYMAISQGIVLGRDFGADVTLFHVSPPDGALQAPCHDLFTKMQWQHVAHRYVDATGEVVSTMLEYMATADIDLVVMGTHRRKRQHEAIASRILQRSTVPTFVVHPHCLAG